MIRKEIAPKDFMVLLLNILGNKQWKYGYKNSKELEKHDSIKNEFNSLSIYPVLIYMENKRIIQSKKRMVEQSRTNIL